jgi:hypothetical protein
MGTPVVVSGSNFTVSAVGEKNWGQNTSDLLIALAAAVPGNSGFLVFESVTSSPISASSGKTYLVNTTAARTINLPAPAANAYMLIKDVSGQAETNNITLHPTTGVAIDGVTGDKIVSINNAFVWLISDGVGWYVLLEI